MRKVAFFALFMAKHTLNWLILQSILLFQEVLLIARDQRIRAAIA
jgi:hypothetical protein